MAVKNLGAVVAALERAQKAYHSDKVLRVGFLEGARYTDTGTPVALVAAVQEFGSPANNIPPRPFFRTAIEQNKQKWADRIAELLPEMESADAALNMAAEVIEDDVRMSIRDGGWAPNAPSTLRQKKFDKPLIDTGHMARSVNHDLEGET